MTSHLQTSERGNIDSWHNSTTTTQERQLLKIPAFTKCTVNNLVNSNQLIANLLTNWRAVNSPFWYAKTSKMWGALVEWKSHPRDNSRHSPRVPSGRGYTCHLPCNWKQRLQKCAWECYSNALWQSPTRERTKCCGALKTDVKGTKTKKPKSLYHLQRIYGPEA